MFKFLLIAIGSILNFSASYFILNTDLALNVYSAAAVVCAALPFMIGAILIWVGINVDLTDDARG